MHNIEIGPRSEVHETPPIKPGFGSSRSWGRTINGRRYSFTAILMPDGERRYSVDVFNEYVGGPEFGCAWDTVHQITVPVQWQDPDYRCPFCGAWDMDPESSCLHMWCPKHGLTEVDTVNSGSGPGFTGAAIYWTQFQCGCQDVDTSGDNLGAVR